MADEIVYVDTREVSCEGESEVVGHPKIYLTIPHDKSEIVCPYCSKVFKHQ
jgi:uncharacterized Zn-finger protein